MATSIISLTTDLGLNDHYVGVMKGVIWKINPEVNIVDICHTINPFDIVEAAFKLECSYRYFPHQTVNVVIVDPGVGSPRRPILAAGDTQYFIAPDNGVLSWVINSDNVQRVYELTSSHYFLQTQSKTFHGRDIFAPCAAHLSRLLNPEQFGDEITDFKRFKIPICEKHGDNELRGRIISIDRFGNCISNICQEDIEQLMGEVAPEKISVTVGSTHVKGLSEYYAQKEAKQPVIIIGNASYLELSINKGNAARELQIKKNMDVVLSVK